MLGSGRRGSLGLHPNTGPAPGSSTRRGLAQIVQWRLCWTAINACMCCVLPCGISLETHTVTLVLQVNSLLAATLLFSCHLHFKHLNSCCQIFELGFGQLSSRGSGSLVVFLFAWLSFGQCHCGRVCKVVGGVTPDCKSASALPSRLTLTFCPPPLS